MSTTPTRPQLAIYAALAIAVLLIGSRFLRAGQEAAAPGGAPVGELAAAPVLGDGIDGREVGAGILDGDAGGSGGAAPRVVVDVKGAVRRPGVYRLPRGARAHDAVRRAGGLTRRADRVGVNLAARVTDGGEVIVPERGRAGTVPTGGTTAGAGGGEAGGPLALDINTATLEELQQLDGVGPATAAAIVAYREQHGGFSSLDELDEVRGIGEVRLASIRDQLGR